MISFSILPLLKFFSTLCSITPLCYCPIKGSCNTGLLWFTRWVYTFAWGIWLPRSRINPSRRDMLMLLVSKRVLHRLFNLNKCKPTVLDFKKNGLTKCWERGGCTEKVTFCLLFVTTYFLVPRSFVSGTVDFHFCSKMKHSERRILNLNLFFWPRICHYRNLSERIVHVILI